MILALAAQLGCAFTNETITPPRRRDVATDSRRGRDREIVVVSPFDDRRPDQNRCGMKKNGYNVDVANILCSASPDVFLSQLLTQELRASGFKVAPSRKDASPTATVVRGVLHQFFVEPKSNFFAGVIEADVELTLNVQGDGFVARRRFFVKGEEGTLMGSPQDLQAASDSAIRELMLDAVGALSNLLDRREPASPAPGVAQ